MLAQPVLVWANTRAWLCTTVLAGVLIVLSGGSLIAGVVAAITHSWWWIIAVLTSILLILQWGDTTKAVELMCRSQYIDIVFGNP